MGTGKASSSSSSQRQITLGSYVTKTQALLDLERDAEKEASLARNEAKTSTSQGMKRFVEKGRAIKGLRITNVEGGLLGQSLVTLERNSGCQGGGGSGDGPGGQVSASTKFTLSPHDIVVVKPSKGDANCEVVLEGVVYRVREASIVIACDNLSESFDNSDLGQSVRVEKLANEVTFNRLKLTLDRLEKEHAKDGQSDCWRMIDCVFGSTRPSFANTLQHLFLDKKEKDSGSLEFFNPNLDNSQREAVSHALRAQDLAIVHGPPGTGKTTTVVEIVLQEALRRGSRVLVCAASNVAVDNLVERIRGKVAHLPKHAKKFKIVRIGHPARLLPQVLDVCLDSLVLSSDSSQLADDCVKEIKDINRKLLKLKRHEKNARREMRKELKYLNKEVRARHKKAISEVLSSAQVVACTLTGCMMRQVDKESFDLVIVDEAAQATECATWSALMKGRRAVLCGDHLQLPPTVISDEAEKKGLGVPLFERLHKRFGKNIAQMLTVQYRMNESIMKWSSDEFYKSKLVAHESVADHTLSQLKHVEEATNNGDNLGEDDDMDLGECVLHMVDTTGLEMFERQDEENLSYSNDGESEAVVKHIRDLLDLGLREEDIGVITPYSAQVSLLKQLCTNENLKEVEVSTVDGFQGREKEAIILSTVRSNESSTVGFLADPRRMNVAVTRARRHCSLICDSETISNDKMLKGLVEYFMDNGEYTFAEGM